MERNDTLGLLEFKNELIYEADLSDSFASANEDFLNRVSYEYFQDYTYRMYPIRHYGEMLTILIEVSADIKLNFNVALD